MNEEFKLFDLEITVVGDPESFACSHKLGEAFEVVGENLVFDKNNSFSMYSLGAILPLLAAKQRSLDANDWMVSDDLVVCPDPNCGAQFKIERKDRTTFIRSETTKTPPPSQ